MHGCLAPLQSGGRQRQCGGDDWRVVIAEDRLSAFGAARRLRTALRRARDACGFRQVEVAAAMDWSPSKLMRIESGAVSISSINDLRALCRHYGIGPSIVEQLVQYQRAVRQLPWWYAFKADIPPALGRLIDLESEENTIRLFAATQVPGLLQTKAYAGEIAKLGLHLARGEEPSGSVIQTMVAI
jgi:transcriptional regulator with XRE-family HTH domain